MGPLYKYVSSDTLTGIPIILNEREGERERLYWKEREKKREEKCGWGEKANLLKDANNKYSFEIYNLLIFLQFII